MGKAGRCTSTIACTGLHIALRERSSRLTETPRTTRNIGAYQTVHERRVRTVRRTGTPDKKIERALALDGEVDVPLVVMQHTGASD